MLDDFEMRFCHSLTWIRERFDEMLQMINLRCWAQARRVVTTTANNWVQQCLTDPELNILISNKFISNNEAAILKRIRDFFWYPRLTHEGQEPQWGTIQRLCRRAFGCRERWLHGELSLSGFGVDDITVADGMGKYDFCFPAQLDPISPKTGIRGSNEHNNNRSPPEVVELVAELNIWAGGVFKEPEGVHNLLNSLENGQPLGSTRISKKNGEERWGLISDFHRLRMVNIPNSPNVFRLLMLVIDRQAVKKSSSWGQFVCHPQLNFIEATPLPHFVDAENLWVRSWRVMPIGTTTWTRESSGNDLLSTFVNTSHKPITRFRNGSRGL